MNELNPVLYHVILAVERAQGWENLIQQIVRNRVPELPEFTVEGEIGTCAVCLEPLKIGDKIRRLPCSTMSHAFHTECIDPWLERKLSCPVCRARIL